MDFTREPIIETVITPKEGCKLVVRSSKSGGQEEYFVDAVEVVSFGSSLFFRSTERPKSFLVPVTDYEVLEVREARMVLKHVGIDRSIKIGGGRDANVRAPREAVVAKHAPDESEQSVHSEEAASTGISDGQEAAPEAGARPPKRERRRNYRRRRGRDEGAKEGEETSQSSPSETLAEGSEPASEPKKMKEGSEAITSTSSILTTLLPPPPTLISESIARYKDNALFKGAFFTKEEKLEAGMGDEGTATEVAEELLSNSEMTSEGSPASTEEPSAEFKDITLVDDVHDDLWGFISEELPKDNHPT